MITYTLTQCPQCGCIAHEETDTGNISCPICGFTKNKTEYRKGYGSIHRGKDNIEVFNIEPSLKKRIALYNECESNPDYSLYLWEDNARAIARVYGENPVLFETYLQESLDEQKYYDSLPRGVIDETDVEEF